MDSGIILQGYMCPFCSNQFVNISSRDMTDHIIGCARERVGLTHPEVADDPDIEDPEAPPGHHSRK